jgi:hypothetical protein
MLRDYLYYLWTLVVVEPRQIADDPSMNFPPARALRGGTRYSQDKKHVKNFICSANLASD